MVAMNREGEIQEREVVAAGSRGEGTQEWATQAPLADLGFPGHQGRQGRQVPLGPLPADRPTGTNPSPCPTSFPLSL